MNANYKVDTNPNNEREYIMVRDHSSRQTNIRINRAKELGYTIIEGNNPFMNQTKKYRDYDMLRLCQTNSSRHGHSTRTVWAIKKKTTE